MDANGKFYKFTFILNFILGILGFLVIWGIRALTKGSLIGTLIPAVLFLGIAIYVNYFIVRRTKLKMKYLFFGPIVNAVFCAVPTVLVILFL